MRSLSRRKIQLIHDVGASQNRAGFDNTTIFAAPNGVSGSTPCSGTGSGDSGCGWPAGNNNMELMDAIVKQVTDNFCVDTDHIYATGWSYGASTS
jgi:poly(3-hydroxybutyrate) depolymerase